MLISLDILDRKRMIFLVLDILLIFVVNKYHIMNILAKKMMTAFLLRCTFLVLFYKKLGSALSTQSFASIF